jgi:hypothetical protein
MFREPERRTIRRIHSGSKASQPLMAQSDTPAFLSTQERAATQQEELFIRGRQAPISMRIRPRQSGAKLTFLAWLSPAGGAANRQRLCLTCFHNCIMPLLLNSELVNSDHSVAACLIRGWLVRGFRIRTRVRKALKKKCRRNLRLASRFWVFWIRNTIRNVTIVVAVLARFEGLASNLIEMRSRVATEKGRGFRVAVEAVRISVC